MFKRYSKPATKNPTSIKDTAQPAVIKPVADISIEKPKDILPTITPVVAPVSSDGQVKDQKRKDRLIDVRMQMHKRLLETLNLAAIDKASESDLRREISAVTIDGLQEIGIVLNKAERDHLVQELVDEVTGLGPLEPLLRDDDIADILKLSEPAKFVTGFARSNLHLRVDSPNGNSEKDQRLLEFVEGNVHLSAETFKEHQARDHLADGFFLFLFRLSCTSRFAQAPQ